MARRNCYNCPHQKEIDRLREVCLGCQSMRDCDHYPSRTVSIDAMKRGDGDGILRRQGVEVRHATSGENLTPLPPDAETRLREKLAHFQSLAFINKILLVWLMGGGGLAEFSKMEWLPKCVRQKGSMSRQAVKLHVRTLKRQMPELEKFVQSMVDMNSGNRSAENRKCQKNRKCLVFRQDGRKHG